MRKGFSPIILICGQQRIGKSFVGVWLWFRILSLFQDVKEEDIRKYVFYDPIESAQAIDEFRGKPILIDEAGSIFHKAEWYRRTAIVFDKILMTQGYKNNMYIIISPFSADVTKGIKHHIDYIISVKKKGIIQVKKVPKRYDDMVNSMGRPFIIENIKIGKNAIPKSIWDSYEEFSFKRKKELQLEFMDDIMDYKKQEKAKIDPFGRVIYG